MISGKGIVPDVPAEISRSGGLGPVVAGTKPGSLDPAIELAFDLVKASVIFEHAAAARSI